jgi:hypothetical protein
MTTTVSVPSLVITLQARLAINVRMSIAGIEANAHFTMKITIDQNGMWMSVTTTRCMFTSSFIWLPLVSKGYVRREEVSISSPRGTKKSVFAPGDEKQMMLIPCLVAE